MGADDDDIQSKARFVGRDPPLGKNKIAAFGNPSQGDA
jgi:hypothetical protein